MDPAGEISAVESLFQEYLSLLHGLLYNVGGGTAATDSKMRKLVRFRWTSSICGSVPL